MKTANYNSQRLRAGFTLVEILVVLVIASILAAVTLGGYSAMRASNRRTTCQANMAQIYQAIRLYTVDYGGEAPYYDPNNTLGNGTGLGLWALYGFPSATDANAIADANIKPEKRYLSNPKLFHCPADLDNEQLYVSGTSNTEYDQDFISYQIADPDSGEYTYNAIRTTNSADSDWQRQLLHWNGTQFISRPPTDDTVVLWCPFHRNSNGSGEDNVLFWDGSVQSIPVQQVEGTITYTDWQRFPEHKGS